MRAIRISESGQQRTLQVMSGKEPRKRFVRHDETKMGPTIVDPIFILTLFQ